MDSAFLILVAIPLGIYVVALLLNTRDLGDETLHEDAAHLTQASVSAHDTVNTHAELPLPSDAPALVDAPLTEAAQSSTTVPTASGTIKDEPISSEVVLAHELTSAPVASPSDTETKASAAATARADALVAESESPTVQTVAALPRVQAETASEPTSESILDASAQPAVTETDSTASAIATTAELDPTPQETEPETESDAAAETAAETASQPIVAEELEANPAIPKPLPEPESPSVTNEPDEDDPILPEGPVTLPDKGSPKYVFDYRGRLWVEKKNKGFFRALRRPNFPPEDPSNNSQR